VSFRRSPWHGGGAGSILGFPPAISQLVLINVIIFLLQRLTPWVQALFALVPAEVVTRGMVWQLVTYMFLHGGFTHILFNMFGLVIFGSDLERWWGSRDFLKYYFISGIGAGIIQILAAYAFPGHRFPAYDIPVIGASGAIFGVLVAYAMAFPNRQVLLWFVIPVSARTMVILFGLIELVTAFQQGGESPVAHFAHLGGMLVGYLYLKHETLLWRLKRRLRGVDPHLPRGSDPGEDDAQRKEQIDRILDKISREGMGSLSKEERRILAESAERARKRQRGGTDG
jgi:membrane associated rhomboid family serine protease